LRGVRVCLEKPFEPADFQGCAVGVRGCRFGFAATASASAAGAGAAAAALARAADAAASSF
jgi:hypothetical protein